MKRAGDLIAKWGNRLLNSRRDALIYVSVFAMLPFTAWLAVALVGLITLRKGKEAGINILLPAMVAHLVSLMTIVPLETAIINVLITFVPVYIAASVLRAKANWSLVFGALMLQSLIGVILMQCFAPDAVVVQYVHFQSLITELPVADQLVQAREYLASLDQLLLAHAFFGIQVLIIAFSATISLLFARFIQSTLFMPGEFKKEIAAFRSGKGALLILTILLIAGYFKTTMAVDLLPIMLFYFFLSGLNLSFIILAQKKIIAIMLFIVSLIISPFTMCMICSFLGIVDSLFNFRIYFLATARKSI
jgi:hypothetical protein